jgi:hypothetical protein
MASQKPDEQLEIILDAARVGYQLAWPGDAHTSSSPCDLLGTLHRERPHDWAVTFWLVIAYRRYWPKGVDSATLEKPADLFAQEVAENTRAPRSIRA